MNADFGLLVDFLRGELDEPAMAQVRARLEHEDALFRQFERLRRTYAVLRSLPRIGPAQAGATPETIPLTEPRPEFVRDVRHEFQARGWAGLIPNIIARPEYLAALRVEFSVRAICASLPMLLVGDSLLQALRAEFSTYATVGALPFIKARPEWIKALRREFTTRALVASLPLLDVRPEYAAALRAEFTQRALVGSVPAMDVRAGFERRLKVALVEASAQAQAAPVEAKLPAVDASDPFRRRLFRKILVNSRRRVRETPKRVDIEEYQWGRELQRGWKRSRRSVGFTLALHAVAIVIMLFVFVKHDTAATPYIAIGESSPFVAPPSPTPELGDGPKRVSRETPLLPGGDDWASFSSEPPVGLDGSAVPEREQRVRDNPQPPPPVQIPESERVLGFEGRDSAGSFFRLRGATRREKIDYLGSEALYEALDSSLAWLQRHQLEDGSWGYVDVPVRLIPQDPELQEIQKLELTSAAVLAFLGDGHSSSASPLGYDITVDRAIGWILGKQRADGQIGPQAMGNVLIHAMATLALAEEFGMTRANRLREPLRKACRWLCEVKAEGSGGFPFLIGRPASLTTSVWAYMALATARNVQVPPIDLPQERINKFLEWFEDITRYETSLLTDDAQVLAKSQSMLTAAAGSLSLFAVEAGYEERCKALVSKASRELPDFRSPGFGDRDIGDARFLFFGSMSQALNLQRNGQKSNEWYGAFSKTLLENQLQDGSYGPTTDYSRLYGKVYNAAFASLSIENAYRVSILNK
ncbi:MAG: terpene cyclase/mutase family protein [Planctomycetes bacterium]|nr:terpene cyclase/mutase family protein [Planctomycetota bacterium]MCB9936285.1 terpene cyclase/mutase family protein [Planctomycetota bacterium]